MKKMKKGLLIALLTLIAALCFAVVACGKGGITFKFVTGDGAPAIEDVQPEAGSEYTLPTPVWEGHSFEGWFLNPEFSGNPVTSQKAEQDTTFYAKWETMYLVTLDLDGGTLAQNTLYLKAGAGLTEALQSYVPTKAGFEFGEWLNGTTALAANAKMPQENITLKAHYKVGYTIELYLQDRTVETTYTKAETDYTGYAYANGQPFAPDYAPEGYVAVTHEGEVTSLTLDGSDVSKNHFKKYYNLKTVTVSFNDPYSDTPTSVSGKYGDKIDLPVDGFTREGYLLVGWSENRDGSNMVPVAHKVYNEAEFTPAQYELTKDVALIAVWQQGSKDIFGGIDHIYLINDTIYLQRAGFLFAGEKRSEALYTFSAEGKILLTCQVFENGTFCYSSDARSSYSASLYDGATGEPDANHTIYFDDGYNGLRYIVKDEEGATVTYTGTFSTDEDGYYRTQFEEASSGDLIDDFTFLTARVENDAGNDVNVFLIRNEADYKRGKLTLLYSTPDGMKPNTYGITVELDGFDTGEFFDGEDSYTVYYYFDEETFEGLRVLVLYTIDEETEQEQLLGAFLVDTYSVGNQKVNGFVYFDPQAYGTFEEENEGGGVLTLDGMTGATWVKDGKTVKGYYDTFETITGDTIVYLYEGNSFKAAFSIAVNPVRDEEGKVTSYEYTYVQYGHYGEYYFATADGYNAKPEGYNNLLMIAGVEENTFSLHLISGNYMYRIANGTLSLKDSVYTATIEKLLVTSEDLTADELKLPTIDTSFDLFKLKSFDFMLLLYEEGDEELTLMSWSSYTLEVDGDEDGVHTLGTIYNEKDVSNGGTLTVYNGTALYTDKTGEGAKTYRGGFSNQQGLYYSLVVDEDTVYRFVLDTSAKTYQLLDNSKFEIIYSIDEEGYPDTSVFLFQDDLGKAFYCTVDEKTKDVTKVEGTITKLEETPLLATRAEVWSFTSTDSKTSFKFLKVTEEGMSFFFKEIPNTKGTYTNENGDELILDGFFYATYSASGQGTIDGYYSAAATMGEHCVYFESFTSGEFDGYFDLEADEDEHTFTLLGDESGMHLLFDNRQFRGEYLTVDGKGKLTVSAEADDKSGDLQVVASGTYKRLENGTYELDYTYTEGNKKVKITGIFSLYEESGRYYKVFYILYEESLDVFLNPTDWSVMVLDGFGNALYYGTDGAAEYGTYTLLDTGLLFFRNDSGTSACVYHFDTTKHEITPCNYEDTGFYTSDFESLLFIDYGYILQEGDLLCYYSVDAQGNVSLYYASTDESQKDVTADKINKYGFVKETFPGKLTDDTVTFNGKKYYRNSGLSITFKRTTEATKYPFPEDLQGVDAGTSIEDLIFAPSTSGSTVRGQARITVSGKPQWALCTVAPIGESKTNFKVRIGIGGSSYLEYNVTIDYKGEDSTYTITSMSYAVDLYFEYYLQMYQLFYQYFGYTLPNSFGTLSIVQDYNDAGKPNGTEHITSSFGEDSGFLDTKGKVFQLPAGAEFKEVRVGEEDNPDSYTYYEVTFKHAEEGGTEYEYCFDFQTTYNASFDVNSFYVISLTRIQTFKSVVDGYDLRVERLLTTDLSDVEPGYVWEISLEKAKAGGQDGELDTLKYDFYYMSDDLTVVIVVKNAADGAESNTYTHYIVTFTDGTAPDTYTVPAYKEAKVEKKTATVYYTAENKEAIAVYQEGDTFTVAYIDFDPSNEQSQAFYGATKTEKATDGSYTVTLDDETQYKLTITEGTATLELIEAEPEVTPEEG